MQLEVKAKTRLAYHLEKEVAFLKSEVEKWKEKGENPVFAKYESVIKESKCKLTIRYECLERE